MSLTFTIVGIAGIPRTIGILVPIFFFLGLVFGRILVGYIINDLLGQRSFVEKMKRVLIYGAGSAGQQLALSTRHYPGIYLLEFIDDDKRLRGQRLNDIPVFHSSDLIVQVGRLVVSDILLAVSRMQRSMRKKIVDELQQLSVYVQPKPSSEALRALQKSARSFKKCRCLR